MAAQVEGSLPFPLHPLTLAVGVVHADQMRREIMERITVGGELPVEDEEAAVLQQHDVVAMEIGVQQRMGPRVERSDPLPHPLPKAL